MADLEQLAKLKKNVKAWNTWRLKSTWKIDLSGANLTGTNLGFANLSGANLTGSKLTGAGLLKAEFVQATLTGADIAGADLNSANLIEANLKDANLAGANLVFAAFNGANMTGADLRHANLEDATLFGSNLHESNLRKANLIRANLEEAILSKANLTEAVLRGTNLKATNLTEAIFAFSILGDTNLTSAFGLDTCEHFGPSIIDHSTFAQSGPLPLTFLRGCGVPDNLITYLPSLLNQPIQFYSCFISYSTKDQEFADRLHADLQNKGVRCWFAPHDMAAGKKIHEQIDEAIRVYDRLLLILSENSMKSPWVKTEIANARKKQAIQKRQVLFPIRLVPFEAIRPWRLFDADVGDDSAAEVREYFIPDFTNWKTDHDAYKQTFERLVRDLQTKDKASAADT